MPSCPKASRAVPSYKELAPYTVRDKGDPTNGSLWTRCGKKRGSRPCFEKPNSFSPQRGDGTAIANTRALRLPPLVPAVCRTWLAHAGAAMRRPNFLTCLFGVFSSHHRCVLADALTWSVAPLHCRGRRVIPCRSQKGGVPRQRRGLQ